MAKIQQLVPLTPLQSLIGFDYIPRHMHLAVELMFANACFLAAIALRRRKTVVSSAGFLMLGLGALLDLIATAAFANQKVADAFAGIAVILFFWGVIRLIIDALTYSARRVRRNVSTILRDLVSLSLYAAVLIGVLATEFQVNLYSLVAAGGVLGVVIGFAVQQTLGDIFSGLALQLQPPFNPGDWVRTGNFLARVQGVGVRSTTLITRHNERLEVPNSAIAKDVLVNYGTPPVADEIVVGVGYNEPPNRVRETLLKVMRDVPHVLMDPSPEILAWEYGDSAIKYRIKYWMSDYSFQETARTSLVTSLWYTLRRHGMEIPYPTQTMEVRRPKISRHPQEEFEREMVEELRQVDFLSNLSEQEIRLLVPTVQAHEFGAGETIFTQGELGDTMYIIRRGKVDAIGHTQNGSHRLVATLSRPQIIGEGAMMTGEPRNLTCKAKTDVELLELNRESFAELFKQHPEAVVQIGEVIANRAAERKELLKESGHDGVTARRNKWIAKVREIFDV